MSYRAGASGLAAQVAELRGQVDRVRAQLAAAATREQTALATSAAAVKAHRDDLERALEAARSGERPDDRWYLDGMRVGVILAVLGLLLLIWFAPTRWERLHR